MTVDYMSFLPYPLSMFVTLGIVLLAVITLVIIFTISTRDKRKEENRKDSIFPPDKECACGAMLIDEEEINSGVCEDCK